MYIAVLQGTLKAACCIAVACVSIAAESTVVPQTVCEVLRDFAAQDGKEVALLGRYSYRTNDRWMGEQSCVPPLGQMPTLVLQEESSAPKTPDGYVINGAELHRKLADMQRRTSLGKFRFGTPDYDRWAVVYGRVEKRLNEDTKKQVPSLVFRGSGVVIFLAGDE